MKLVLIYTLIAAVVESTRKASECTKAGYLTAARLLGGEIQLTATDTDAGWRSITLPAPTPQNA